MRPRLRGAGGAAFAAAVAAVLSGCAATTAQAPSVSDSGLRRSSELALTRDVHAITVADETGTAYPFAWLGGLNLPRPQAVDIDGDGDLDLFAQEASDQLMFFENIGSPEGGGLQWRTDSFQNLSVGEWYRFADMDGDGDLDLLAEQPFSFVRYYRNEGTSQEPRFALATDTLRDVAGQPIFSDRQNIPNVTDIDCDGLLDLFIGRLTGTVSRYEEVNRDADEIPRFRLVTERFQNIEIVAQIGSLHGANTLALEDIDDDGDMDIFWGDFFEPGLLLLENGGSCQSPAFDGQPQKFPPNDPLSTSGYNAPSFGDADGDGDLDMLVGVLGGAFNPNLTTVDNLLVFEQTEPGVFEQTTGQLLRSLDVGSESAPVLTDLDGDGDLDLLVSNKIDPGNLESGFIYHFENIGSAGTPSFRLLGKLAPFEGSFHPVPAFGDLDGDGDLDAMVGSWRKGVRFYRNAGTAAAAEFVLDSALSVELTRGSNSVPALADIDGDGDLDLFAGESSGDLNFWRNTGAPEAPQFTLESDKYEGMDAGRRSFPALVDLDGDGDLDLALGSEKSGIVYYRNDGDENTPVWVRDESFAPAVPSFAAPAFADIDADGDLDFLSGGIGGGVMFWRNGTN
ncbi:MAG: FG-GAP-like repeat-containing protein [Gemmatimonadota bacterium]